MASTGVFTFNTAGTYIVTVNLNVTGTPDVWGRVNSTDTPRYMQLAGSVTKTTLSDVISVSVNDTFDLYINSALTVNGALSDTATKISFVKIN
jgi:peroxiredoxin